MGRKGTDLTGKRFGKLEILEPAYKDKYGWKWRCKCDCGNEVILYGRAMLSGGTRSCGCLNKIAVSEARTTHHKSKNRLYPIWAAIKQRCLNPHSSVYEYYGGRGIEMCSEWRDSFEAFYEWAIANGYDENAPRGECTIDRIDVNGNYEPSNCRWVNIIAQANNMRTQRLITWNGKTMGLSAWARELGIKRSTLNSRLECGWSLEKAFTTSPTR